MKLSVIIPVYNENKTILEIIKKVNDVKIDIEKEIIVVDGHSTNGTIEKLKQAEKMYGIKTIFEDKREGKGAAIRKGLELVTGDIVIIQDADLEVTPDEYPALLKHIISGEYKVVFGSRFMSKAKFRFVSLIANKIILFLTNLLYNAKLTDVLTCYKMFKTEVLKNLKLECKGFDLDVEVALKIIKNRIKIKEVPITYTPRTYGQGKKINWKDGFRSLYILLKSKLI